MPQRELASLKQHAYDNGSKKGFDRLVDVFGDEAQNYVFDHRVEVIIQELSKRSTGKILKAALLAIHTKKSLGLYGIVGNMTPGDDILGTVYKMADKACKNWRQEYARYAESPIRSRSSSPEHRLREGSASGHVR